MKHKGKIIGSIFVILLILEFVIGSNMLDIMIMLVICWNIWTGVRLFGRRKGGNDLIYYLYLGVQIATGGFYLLNLTNFSAPPNLGSSIIFIMSIAYIWSTIQLTSLLIRSEKEKSISNNGLITWVLIYVLPFGVWWIQPRIEKLI
jgi:hypothetical protein